MTPDGLPIAVDELTASRETDALVAAKVLGWTGIGYYGPPVDSTEPWAHNKSVRYDTCEEALQAYRVYYEARIAGGDPWHRKLDRDPSLCHWADDWGPLTVDDFSEYESDAMRLLRVWDGDVDIRRKGDHWRVGLFWTKYQWDGWAETLALATCRAMLRAAADGMPMKKVRDLFAD